MANDSWSAFKVEMLKADFETWVKSLTPLGFENSEQPIFRLGAANAYGRDWVDARLKSTICTMLKGLYKKDIDLEIVVANGFYNQDSPQSGNLEIDPLSKNKLRVAMERPKSVQTIDQEYTKPVRTLLQVRNGKCCWKQHMAVRKPVSSNQNGGFW